MTCERFQTTLVSEVPIATRVGKFTRNPFREPVSLQSTSSLTWPRREKNISKYRTSTLTTTIRLETLIYSAVLSSTKKKINIWLSVMFRNWRSGIFYRSMVYSKFHANRKLVVYSWPKEYSTIWNISYVFNIHFVRNISYFIQKCRTNRSSMKYKV